jgi:hypothetical protein
MWGAGSGQKRIAQWCDAMESYLAGCGNDMALGVARELDREVLGVLEKAA